MRTNVLNDLSNVVKKGTILAGSAAAAVDSCAAGSTTLAEYPGNHPEITQLSPRNHPLLDAIWKHVAMIFAVLVMSIGNVCGTPTQSYVLTGSSSTIANGKTANIGGAYCGRKGSGITLNATYGLPSGGGNSAAVFVVNQTSNITFILDNQQTSAKSGNVLLASVSDSYYTDCQNGTLGNLPSTASQTKAVSFAKNADSGENEFTFESSVSAGKYVVYWTSGINASIYLKRIEINATGGGSSYSITYHCNDATSGCPATNPATGQTALPNPLPSVTKTNYTFGGWYTDAAYSSAASAGATLSANADLYAKWTQTITLDREGATTGSTSVTATYNSATLPSITNPTKDGFVFEGWYDGDNGTGNLVINTSGALQANVSGYTGADGIWTSATARTLYAKWTEKTCPSSGTLFSMVMKNVGTKKSIDENEYVDLAENNYATVTGGTAIFGANASGKAEITNANPGKLKFGGAAARLQVTLDCPLQEGDVISFTGENYELSFDYNTTRVTTPATSSKTYTIPAESSLIGKSTIYFWRSGSTTFSITGLTISRLATPSCEAPSSVAISGTSSYLPGQNISLTAAATGGSGTPTTYQWYHRGVAIDGATSATYTKSNCTIDDAGNYTCKVTMGGSCSTTSPNFAVRVYSVKVWSNGGGSVIGNYPLTYQSSNNGRAVISTLSASTTYEFKVIDNVGGTSDSTIYYGNGGTIHHNTAIDPTTWDFGSTTATNCKLVTGVETGDFTFDVDITHNGTGAGFYVTVNVAYPTKTIYLTPGVWNAEGAKFAIHYYDANGGTGWTDFLTANDCGMSAEIPVWDGVKMIAGRFNSTKASTGNWDDKWNQTNDITVSSYNSVVITGWNEGDYTYNSNFSTPTYTISYAKGGTTATGGAAISGSKADESKTCGVDFTLPSSAVFTATGYTQTGWTTSDGGSKEYELGGTYTTNAAQTFYPVWEVAASLTALECNTRYTVQDMTAGGCGTLSGTSCYSAGLSANSRFEVLGDPSKTDQAGGTPEQKTNTAQTINSISFNSFMYLKGDGLNGSTEPTCRGVKFIIPSAGRLTIYYRYGDRSKLKKEGESAVNVGTTTDGYGYDTHDVTAGTYYIYGASGGAVLIAVEYQCCTTPAAPTGFTAGSITSTGATFTITDAAGAASYDIYYSTSNTVPNASTPATTTSTEKTKAVTGLTASTTYYAWVRSVCDASHKSDWVALSGSSFTTTSTPAELTAIEANVLYQAADMANITFTGDDQWFAGLSTNAKFKVYGNGTSTSAFGKNENHSVTDDISKKDFTSALYITAADNTSSDSDPTKGAIEFITPSTAGTLYLYLNTSSSGLSIKKKGTSTSTSLSGGAYKKIAVEANTHYFINGAGSNRGLYGIKFIADVTAPTFVSSVPATGATGVATSGTIVLTFNEPLGSVDASKFTLTGATKGTVTIDGSDATKVNIPYSGAENSSTVTLATAAAAVSDVAGNALAAALSDISFTTAAAGPAGDCITITNFATTNSSNTLNVYKGTISDANKYLGKTTSSSTVGKNSGADLLLKYKSSITIYNAPAAETNFTNITEIHFDVKANDNTKRSGFEVYVGATKVATISGGDGGSTVFNKDSYTTLDVTGLEQLTGYVRITSTSSSGAAGYDTYIDNIQICTSSLPSCITPELPDLSKQTVCEGSNGTSWNAAITNSGSLVSGETVAYSWVKKGSSTVLSSVATYQPTDVTEAMAGTYVVTATVSADGKASKSASKEVELAVNATVEISGVTQSPATVYTGNSVTLTATANVSATWQWYTCTNAEGDGESSIGGATSAAYAFAAPASAGTYYYKVKATGPCGGVATEVYALTISAATGGDCDTYYFFANAADATTNSVTQNEESFFSGASEGTNNNSTSITVDENSLSISKRTSAGAYSVVFTVPTGATATLYTNAKANNTSYPLIITRSSDSEVMEITNSTTLANYTLADIPEGTWTLSSGSGKNWYYGAIIVKVCTGATCTDPAVTASVSKSNVCAGSGEGVTFTASDAHASATYKWQKQNGSTWDDISGATAATYTIATVEASHAGKYRVVASHECDRISNELTLTVATTPVFGDLGGAREVETGGSLSITNVEATSATSYKWYKSANATYDSGSDEQVGTSKNLMLPVNETAGSTFYLFCVASNACTSTVSGAITVNVIAPVEKDCAVGTSNGENFTTAKTSNVNGGSYLGQTELHMNNNNKYIYYVTATGYHFETATVNCCAGDATALTQAAYSYSTDGGETWTDADLPGAMTNQYSNHVVTLPADVNAFRVGRVLGDHGVGSNTLYVHEVCFTYVADCNATTIAISNATPSYDLSVGGDFTEPTCTVKQGGTTLSPQPALRYSSFNEAIATVDPSTGEVDFTGTAGSVMIMASYDGDETYCESSATYTITVSCGSESAPKIVAGSGTNLSGCNAEVNLVVKDQNGNDFASGSYQWYRDGEDIDGATSATYTANRTGTYTVSHTGVCTQMSTNSAVVTSESFDPSVERLVPFQYYHANKTYTDQMKMRHLFAVTSGGDYEGKRYYMTATRNGAPLDITTSTAFSVNTSKDNRVDSVMIDLNKLNGKFNAGDEIVLTCAAIADCGTISAVTENIEIHVIDNTPTLALICSGTNKSAGTRKTSEMTVGGDFLTGYNKADLCEQTGNTSFDANTEWGLYTRLKENYIVTPVNGYAVFNKLNYEPFDILLLTDYPKASKSTEAALILDDMYELCDYRPMLSFKTHMVQPADKLDGRDSHWKKKGFTTLPEAITEGDGRLKMNIVCYAHPMFEEITEGAANDDDDESQIVYTMLSGPGHEGSKGMQGFHLAAAENFVTIGLVHYNATATDNYGGSGNVKWTPGSGDEMLVAAAERQTNLEARFILFSLNCGAQSKLTAQGNTVVLKCLEYLLNDATIEGNVADCALTFDNKAGDHKWSNKANWAPKYSAIPGEYNATRIAAPATVDMPHAKVMSVRIKEGGSIYIPAGSALDVKSTVRHKDVGSDVRPTDVDEIHIGSSASGNGTLIFNNNTGDTKARVDMYSNAPADMENMSAATSVWQYIGTPHTDVTNARSNYYGSWLYQYSGNGWEVIENGGPLDAFRGYCITNETAPIVYDMEGTLAATTTQDIAITKGYTVIANSWTAPIDINAITNDDMEGITDKTIYFFNTGSDADGTAGTGTEAGTYRATPIHSASYTGDWQIPSMQGFYVSTTSAGTLHLDYDRHVRPTGSRSVVSNPMYAPRRAAAESEEPNVLKIFARGSRYQDKLVVLEREDFTRGYDSGWDGEAWGGGKFSPMVYVTGEGREDAVSAIPEFEGTVIAFKAGEDNDYRFDFIYDGEESLYLFDTENSTYTQIMTGESYYFSTDDKAPHSRFILTRRGPQIATGVGEVPSDQVQGTKAKKLLIENKMYILLNGALYDATGKAVK